MRTGIIIFLFFSVMVFVHELGHFISARIFGVKVNEFAIGMGPAVLKKQVGATFYSIRLIPIGGFCKMEGEDEDSPSSDALCKKKWYERLVIMLAGGLTNIFFGFLLSVIMVLVRGSISTTVVESVRPESPAYNFLRNGDKVVKINGARISTIKDIELAISNNSREEYSITVKRGRQNLSVSLKPFYYETEGEKVALIGFNPKKVKANIFNSSNEAVGLIVWMIKLTALSFVSLFSGNVGIREMSGVIGAASMVAKAAKSGVVDLLFLCAFINVNIGIFNLLPLPALDGGRVFFVLLEMIRRKPIKVEHEGMVHFIGFVALVLLSLFVTWNDIIKIIKT